MVHFHLFGEELLQPCVFLDVVMDEAYRLFTLYLHGGFTFLPVVEPCLCPPADTGPVRIYRHDTRYVEALDVDVKFRQRVDDAAGGYCFGMKFFFKSPPIVERYTPCCKAR